MSEISGLLTTFLPLFVIIWVANLAEAQRERGEPASGLSWVVYILMGAMYTAGILAGVFLQLIGVLAEINPTYLIGPLPEVPVDSMNLLALGIWLPSLIGILLLLSPVRRFIAKTIPIDPENPVHAVSLSLTMLAFVNLMVTLGVGLGTFADMLAEEEMGENTIVVLWLQQIMTALLAAIGVGWLTRRSIRPTLDRLGLVIPTGKQWLIGIGCALGMVVIVFFVEAIASSLGFGADADVERLTEQLLGSLFTTPLGILTLGLSAALGEETLFRGAILPRFGLIATSLLFAVIHSQYGITLSTLLVFILGMLLGLLRLRYNTSTAMITHATYNMTLGLIAYLSTMVDV
jgi:membrane protease YdiL (CAAX protease family)